MTVISGPVPPYSNVPIEPGFYEPSRFVIDTIVPGSTTLVTTVLDLNYVVGQLVRILVPSFYGCSQLNGRQGYVVELIGTDTVEIAIDSSVCDPFIGLPVDTNNPPQIMAIGDINSGSINANGSQYVTTYIQGSFINISPN